MTDFTILRADDKAVCDYGKNTAVLALYEALITPEHGSQLIEALIGSMNNPQDAELLREGAWYAAVSMTFTSVRLLMAKGFDPDAELATLGLTGLGAEPVKAAITCPHVETYLGQMAATCPASPDNLVPLLNTALAITRSTLQRLADDHVDRWRWFVAIVP